METYVVITLIISTIFMNIESQHNYIREKEENRLKFKMN